MNNKGKEGEVAHGGKVKYSLKINQMTRPQTER